MYFYFPHSYTKRHTFLCSIYTEVIPVPANSWLPDLFYNCPVEYQYVDHQHLLEKFPIDRHQVFFLQSFVIIIKQEVLFLWGNKDTECQLATVAHTCNPNDFGD